jgi:hypothetical protein
MLYEVVHLVDLVFKLLVLAAELKVDLVEVFVVEY